MWTLRMEPGADFQVPAAPIVGTRHAEALRGRHSAYYLAMLAPCCTTVRHIATAVMVATTVAWPALPVQAAGPDLGRNVAANCAACHGTNGASAGGIPALAGQPQQVLQAAIKEFRAGTRPGTIMNQLAKGYTDAQIEAVSAYFASQRAR